MSLNRTRLWEHVSRAGSTLARTALSGPAEALAAAYAYDRSAVPAVTEVGRPDPEYRLLRVELARPGGEGSPGLFLRPAADGVYPCVLLLHALTSDKETMVRHFGRALAARGLAVLALDAPLHGERRGAEAGPSEPGPLEYLELARSCVLEYRRALDYLESRPDVDGGQVGLLGYSLGAMLGAVLAGVDERVRATALLVGGDMVRAHLEQVPGFLRGALEPFSPANFVSRISPRPVLFINGKWDTTVPRSAAVLLHEAAREPKEIVWAEAGHRLPPDVAGRAVEWLEARLARA